MAPRALSDSDPEALRSWPPEVAPSDLVEYFALDVGDLRWVRSHRGAATRLGLGVQLCALRFLGFVPTDLASTPFEVAHRLAERIGVAPSALAGYVAEVDGRLRRLHVASVVERAGWRNCGPSERKRLADWLLSRALEHDDAPLLFALALEHLRAERVVRPGLDRLLREVTEARALADREVHWRLRPQLDPPRCAHLDAVLANDAELGMAPLTWLDKGAPSSSPDAIKSEVAKLGYLRELGARTASTCRPSPPSGSASWPGWAVVRRPRRCGPWPPSAGTPFCWPPWPWPTRASPTRSSRCSTRPWPPPRAGPGPCLSSASWRWRRPTSGVSSCSTRYSTSPWTAPSTMPGWEPVCGAWVRNGSPRRCAARTSAFLETAATWRSSRPATPTSDPSPPRPCLP